MRYVHGNPHNEAHGNEVYMIEWTTASVDEPQTIIETLEAALPGIKLFHRGDGEVDGYVNTRDNGDGTRLIQLCVYNFGCDDPNCAHGEGAIHLREARWLNDADHVAMLTAVPEQTTRTRRRSA